MIQPTSRSAYYEIQPTLGNRQHVVLDCIREYGPITNTEISVKLKIPINAITPRTKELRKLGLVSSSGKRTCNVTGKTCLVWEAVKYTLF